MTSPPPRCRLAVAIGVVVAASAVGRARAADGTASSPPTEAAVPEGTQSERHTDFFPLPLYATSPAEGSTYGVLPVWMRLDGAGRTTSIWAPSLSWNSAAGVNGTFRYYSFPEAARAWTIILAASTKVNRSLRFDYRNVPGYPKSTTLEVQVLARQNLFYRFFGFGPDTQHSGQSSYTRLLMIYSVRGGLNLARYFNVGVRGVVRWDGTQERAIFNLPPTQELYPGTPGLEGAAMATAELSIRFDTRALGDYDVRGVASELHAARDFGWAGGVSLWRGTWHTRVLWPEWSFVSGAARLYWTDESGGANVPFFYRSALGGDTLFRGFTDDRFIDRGAWEAETEQRFRLFTTDWFHVHADWRVDPFFAIGQVYPKLGSIVSHVRPVGGVGLRAFVHPNVLGRVDVAYSSDGFTAYVILGYPY
jgi:hypothetical protein